MRLENEAPDEDEIHRERWELLEHINAIFEKPLIVLSFVWLVLLILDFTSGLNRPLQIAVNVIWGLFVVDFLLEFTIAPKKWEYLQRNWLTALSLALPAFRVLRIFRGIRFLRVTRAARATRSLGVVRLVTSLNRGMRATRNVLGRHRFGYVLALTTLVIFAGAAGMLNFENPAALRESGFGDAAREGGLRNYADALWWTAMLLTTLGSEYWPKTSEGRITCWLLSIYAFAIFGYITATIASYFIGTASGTGSASAEMAEQPAASTPVEGDREWNQALRELTALRSQVAELMHQVQANSPPVSGGNEHPSGA